MVDELTSGTSIAIEIRLPQNTHRSFREFCGPHDPVSLLLDLFYLIKAFLAISPRHQHWSAPGLNGAGTEQPRPAPANSDQYQPIQTGPSLLGPAPV